MSHLRLMTAALLATTTTLLGGSTVQAQATATLPKAETVLDQYVEATGGKAAYDKLTNRVSNGTIEVTGAGIKGKLTISQAAPNKILNLSDLGAIGKTSQGFDGTTAWETSTINGERILEGEEKDTVASQAIFNSETQWKQRYDKVETLGVEDVEGKPAYKLQLTRKVGAPVVEYYDVASHLLVKQTSISKTPNGEIKVDIYLSDYAKFDGILIPKLAKQKVLGQEILLTITDVKHNVDLPKDIFDTPKAIKDLAAKKKAK